jgi:hypothetical protein
MSHMSESTAREMLEVIKKRGIQIPLQLHLGEEDIERYESGASIGVELYEGDSPELVAAKIAATASEGTSIMLVSTLRQIEGFPFDISEIRSAMAFMIATALLEYCVEESPDTAQRQMYEMIMQSLKRKMS